jgi:hypothetical protein
MTNKVKVIPVVGLLCTIAVAGYMVAQLNGQSSAPTGDYRSAAVAEVRDARGVIVLRGEFVVAEEEDDDIERKAALKETGVDADAAGEAEVEYAKATPTVQEVEFTARNLQPGATFTFVIDGHDVAPVTADRSGKAEVELEVRLPGAPPAAR